ncbi:MAG: YbjN domain-containing protein [Candidatus Sericytochromatia bacterium]|nr:YbjN domain-containing protein [Candidatus Tanganyikabacteria bacterium]
MPDKAQRLRAVYDHLIDLIEKKFGSDAKLIKHPEGLSFGMLYKSAASMTSVLPWRSDDAVVATRSYVVTGATIDADLMRLLLGVNANSPNGAFAIDDEGDIVFCHTILGNSVNLDELMSSITGVITTADEYDDIITAKWGGMRALDSIRASAYMSGAK